jgi:hypothetical protein
MEFDHVTNRYLYPDRYIKMIPYFLKTCLETKLSMRNAAIFNTHTRSIFQLQSVQVHPVENDHAAQILYKCWNKVLIYRSYFFVIFFYQNLINLLEKIKYLCGKNTL